MPQFQLWKAVWTYVYLVHGVTHSHMKLALRLVGSNLKQLELIKQGRVIFLERVATLPQLKKHAAQLITILKVCSKSFGRQGYHNMVTVVRVNHTTTIITDGIKIRRVFWILYSAVWLTSKYSMRKIPASANKIFIIFLICHLYRRTVYNIFFEF